MYAPFIYSLRDGKCFQKAVHPRLSRAHVGNMARRKEVAGLSLARYSICQKIWRLSEISNARVDGFHDHLYLLGIMRMAGSREPNP
jgi:hypothetical protein